MENRYTFHKKEHLYLVKQIDSLFGQGRWLRSQHIRLVYQIIENEIPSPAQVMFTVPKKIHRRAVKRNLLKRRMRESYRMEKHKLYKILEQQKKFLVLALIYSNEEIADYHQVNKEVKLLLAQLIPRLEISM